MLRTWRNQVLIFRDGAWDIKKKRLIASLYMEPLNYLSLKSDDHILFFHLFKQEARIDSLEKLVGRS